MIIFQIALEWTLDLGKDSPPMPRRPAKLLDSGKDVTVGDNDAVTGDFTSLKSVRSVRSIQKFEVVEVIRFSKVTS